MPDYYTGYWDESRLRGAQAAPTTAPTPAASPMPLAYSGMFGNNTVQIYGGNTGQLTDEQARQRLLSSAGTQTQLRSGAMPVSQFQAIFPNATEDELAAYRRLNTAYNQNTKGTGGVGQSLHNAASFELDHIGNIFEGLADEPARLVFGFDPIGTEIGNAVTGRDYDPLVNQMGGATSQQIADYEARNGLNSAGGAQGLHNAAAGTTAVIAAGTLANGGLTGGQTSPTLTTMTPAEQAEITSGLTNVPGGVQGAGPVGFGGAGTAGIPADLAADFAGTQAGAAGNGLVLEGGAGTIGGGWLQALNEYGPKVAGLLDQGGGSSGGAAPPALPSMGMLGSIAQPTQAPPSSFGNQSMPLNQTMQRSRGYMRTPINFRGATIWL